MEVHVWRPEAFHCYSPADLLTQDLSTWSCCQLNWLAREPISPYQVQGYIRTPMCLASYGYQDCELRPSYLHSRYSTPCVFTSASEFSF